MFNLIVKEVKKFKYILVALSFLSIQCTKEDDVNSDSKEVYVEFNVSQPGVSITKTELSQSAGYLSVVWSEGDMLYVIGVSAGYLGTVTLTSGAGTTSGTFAGTITLPATAQKLRLYYFGKDVHPSMTSSTKAYTYQVDSQDGTLSGIQKNLHLMHGLTDSNIPQTQSDPISVSMSSKMAVALFDLTSQSGFSGSSIKCEGAFYKRPLTLKTGKWGDGDASEEIILKNPTNAYYMVLIPGTTSLTFSDGSKWIGCFPSNSIEASKFYSKTGTGTAIDVKLETKDYPTSIAKEGDAIRIGNTFWAPLNCGYNSSHPYGLLYQWGRAKGGGYEGESNQQTAVNSKSASPEDGYFYKTSSESDHYWYNGTTTFTYWPMTSSETGYIEGRIANPCPSGWRVPTREEIEELAACHAEWKSGVGLLGHGSGSYNGSLINGVLFFPAGGGRQYYNTSSDFIHRGQLGYYWCNIYSNPNQFGVNDQEDPAWTGYLPIGLGASVRCVCSAD